ISNQQCRCNFRPPARPGRPGAGNICRPPVIMGPDYRYNNINKLYHKFLRWIMIPIRDSVRPRRIPVVNWLLIGLNVYVFLMQASLSPRELQLFFRQFGVIPAQILHLDLHWLLSGYWEPFLPMLTHMFLHGSWWHLL